MPQTPCTGERRPEGPRQIEDLTTPGTHVAAEAERFLRIGEPLLAYNVLQGALADKPDDLRLRQLKGLALARSGALNRANELLSRLYQDGHGDGETLGLLARTHKDLALSGIGESERQRHLDAAFEFYLAGYRESEERGNVADAYYTGINCATMAFLRDDLQSARKIAKRVEELCETALGECENDADAYWPQATLAEAALILADRRAAKRRYADAAKLAGTRFGDLSSTRRQARLLLEHAGADAGWLDEVLSLPPVIVYTGHMVDGPGRSQPRFEPRMEDALRAAIHARLSELRPAAAYGSAACGADILCLECVRDLGGELHIVLPFPVEQFRATSVDVAGDAGWGRRFERLLEDANEVLVISEQPPEGSTSTFEYANLIMTGLARLRSQILETRLQGFAVWDGEASADRGGTGSMVALWSRVGVPMQRVPISGTTGAVSSAMAGASAAPPVGAGTQSRGWPFRYTIESMMFADATGYSRMTERQIPLFFEHYMGSIAGLCDRTRHRAVHVETAGDGIYMVFDDPYAAAHFAIELAELINGKDWQSLGLPGGLGVRIALHSGPVFVGHDPVTKSPLYSGIHTSRTARIEPVTPPGQVYASSAFAAVATALGVSDLRFSYIGRTHLAKDYGVLPLYHVKRR